MSIINIAGPGLSVRFDYTGDRLALLQVQRGEDAPLLYADRDRRKAGPGPVGNPLAMVIAGGEHAGVHGMDRFKVKQLTSSERRLLAYLEHDALPIQVAIEVEVEGHVATWRGQVAWNGATAFEADIYFPLLSRVRFGEAAAERALVAEVSGAVVEPLSEVNFRKMYMGNLACPLFIVEGGERGVAVLDDNRADFAADPGACVLRSYVIANTLPPKQNHPVLFTPPDMGGEDGPFIGVCHTRRFNPIPNPGEPIVERTAEGAKVKLPMACLGDAADLGPVRTYAYEGNWRVGADWLRRQRRHVPFRVSPAKWYQNTTFLAEDMGDAMLRRGQSFYDYPKLLAHKQTLGADLFHIPGFHDPEVLGSTQNWTNRGDYFLAAQNLGGFEAVRRGVETIHRAGGHILYYVEGLIMWKRSRIGRSQGKHWALMKADGSYDDHYKGFWHMCPASEGWRRWIAQTCADIVASTGIDGFFIDSTCATHNHRCFNPEHQHPHPDVWNWGVRQMLTEIRQAVDRVNPETILVIEGVGDMCRESADGFVSHGHMWSRKTLTEPFVRFLHPDMRAFESWSSRKEGNPEYLQIWNSVTGHRIYSHAPHCDEMAELSRRTRRYYDAFPEVCDSPMSVLEVAAEKCYAQLFDGPPYVVTVGNLTDQSAQASVKLPVPCGQLLDRVDSLRIGVVGGEAHLTLAPWEFRAFELRA